jgi:unsaturated rhamnogalacturonyl hydrolase
LRSLASIATKVLRPVVRMGRQNKYSFVTLNSKPAAIALLSAALLVLPAAASQDPSPADPLSGRSIAALMRTADAWQVAHPVMPDGDRNWQRGTWYTGVMAAYGATGDPVYLDQAMRWSQEQQWKPGTEKDGANVLTCTQTYLELYFLKGDRAFIEPTVKWLDSGRPNTPSGSKVWYLDENRYVDSIYVGAPALAMLAKATGDHRYVDWMNAFFWDVHGELFDQAYGLFYRDKRFIGQKTAEGRKVFWSRGNGWAFASLPRILTYLPEDDASRPRYVALFRQMAAAVAGRQQPDGFWRPNLDDAQEFPTPEASGTGFFCYGLAWGIRNHMLDKETYLPIARRAWSGLAANVSPEGKVQWGQLVGDRPDTVEQGDSHEYVTGTFLLAGSEVFRLAQDGSLGEGRAAAAGSAGP